MEIYDNLTKYRVFIAAARYGSISKAAEQLYISQPAVSTALKKLEENLGTALFLRKPHGVVLTPQGKQLYDRAQYAFSVLSDAENSLKTAQHTRRLRIAASNVLCKHYLMPYLKSFMKRYPQADVSIICTSSANAYSMLAEASVDLVLCAKPDSASGMVYHPLGSIEDIFVCTPQYMQKLNCDADAIFSRANILLLNKDNVSRMHTDKYFENNHILPSHILEANDMDMLIEFARLGIGVSCVVKQFIIDDLEKRTLLQIPLPVPVPPREIGFLYNNVYPQNDLISDFLKIDF